MKLKILAFSRLLLATISLIWMLSNLSLGWTVCLTYEFSLLSFSRVSILLVMLYFLPLLLSTLVLFAISTLRVHPFAVFPRYSLMRRRFT